ncbi:MAG TPA: phage Gp37/Gp68 family protein [Candidatus Rifleibacterium sp.]|nr:phage Gp37/Gp68 family protein [Candidatus Rifleibacterium sp.]
MAGSSTIEWTEVTWNPVTGCTKISAGCKNCYAERMAKRLRLMGSRRYVNEFAVTLHEDLLDFPKKMRAPRQIFVNSMSDLFHEAVPLEFIQKVFATMNACPQHVFQVLTKRSTRLAELANSLVWTKNIWMGVTVEDDANKHRIKNLKNVPAAVRFISFEPLLSEICHPDLTGINWIIVGGESGPGARPIKKEWVESLQENARINHIPFFFKQWGGTNKKKAGKLLNGCLCQEIPAQAPYQSSAAG